MVQAGESRASYLLAVSRSELGVSFSDHLYEITQLSFSGVEKGSQVVKMTIHMPDQGSSPRLLFTKREEMNK